MYSRRETYFFVGNEFAQKLENIQPLLRAELLYQDQMAEHCKTIAGRQETVAGVNINDLLKRFADNEKTLLQVNELLNSIPGNDNQESINKEWKAYFYQIKDQVRKTKNLLDAIDKGLPRLKSNSLNGGAPRIYSIAVEFISHTDSQLEFENLTVFVKAYQEISSLNISELKAMRAILKLALIENLRRTAIRLSFYEINRQHASYWVARIASGSKKGSGSLNTMKEELMRSTLMKENVFIAEFRKELLSKRQNLSFALCWVEDHLSKRGLSINKVTLTAKQAQIADLVSLRNSVSSLRNLDTIDWHRFEDMCSVIDLHLMKDPSAIYEKMDYYTRNYYRMEVGKIARYAGLSEVVVANWVVFLSKNSNSPDLDSDSTSHVGYFLVGAGRRLTERSLGMQPSKKQIVRRLIKKSNLALYLGGNLIVTGLVWTPLFWIVYAEGARGFLLVVVNILLGVCLSQLAKTLIDSIADCFSNPRVMPRLDFSKRIPEEFRTMVVVPALLTGENVIMELVRSMEIRFLANRKENLYFGLLTDFKDAYQETLSEDDSLLEQVKLKVEELNVKYSDGKGDIFYLFHRPRLWNSHDKIWMGYERKRGKLMDLNALLRGGLESGFSHISGDRKAMPFIKYVITLDSDTQLPRDTAWRLVGTMAHPLNRPIYSERKGRVVEGYGMLQPKIETDIREQDNSLFQRIFGSGPSIDPYTRAAPDIYQDLFGEGSFIGKGIYDVDIVRKVLDCRLPLNRILSHDLLEGCYCRSGLLSDVKLYEIPPGFVPDFKRRHRWIRGDWQIAAWILPCIPGFYKRRVWNPISALSRWKIIDNIRNSLIPTTLISLLVIGIVALKHSLFWGLFVMAASLFPSIAIMIGKGVSKSGRVLSLARWKSAITESTNRFLFDIYELICLPFRFFYTLDAIARSSWRMLFSHMKMLEWTSSGSLQNSANITLFKMFRIVWMGPLLGFGLLLCSVIFQRGANLGTLPLMAFWMTSPIIVWWINRSTVSENGTLNEVDRMFLGKLSRRTWVYFEEFVNQGVNWLPPDHYQKVPFPKTANYTSPTNMGLSLLANLAAWEFGYISTGRFIERTTNTLDVMDSLERYRGHFYNWYDIKTLNPVAPRYISIVDSGNLAGHLITLRQGILSIPNQKIIRPEFFTGFRDTLEILREEAKSILRDHLEIWLPVIEDERRNSFDEVNCFFSEILLCIEKMAAALNSDIEREVGFWMRSLEDQVRYYSNELKDLAAWLWLPTAPVKYADLILKDIPTLNELVNWERSVLERVDNISQECDTETERNWLIEYRSCIERSKSIVDKRILAIQHAASQCEVLAEFEFDFFFNKMEKLLSIGYSVDNKCLDSDYYDVLSSEARLATYIGICQNKLPVESWFALGRTLVNSNGEHLILSANGTLFEYLMPLLVMPVFEHTILDLACKSAVQTQMAYGRKHQIPWGVSESGYSTMDSDSNYQYKAFGLAELSLKSNHLTDGRVVAPYASALALMISPQEACGNLKRLVAEVCVERYGLYEAVDYSMVGTGGKGFKEVVYSFMVHHQAMTFLSIAHLLLNKPMQRFFMSDPNLESGLLLLQERVPENHSVYLEKGDRVSMRNGETGDLLVGGGEIFEKDDFDIPDGSELQFLSNGRYHVMVTDSGVGYSQWKDLLLTRWLPSENSGSGIFCYIRELENGSYWPTTCQFKVLDDEYRAKFFPGAAKYYYERSQLETDTRLVVAPDDDVECRLITIRNTSNKSRAINIESYVPIALDRIGGCPEKSYSQSVYHTEVFFEQQAIGCCREFALSGDRSAYLFHAMKMRCRNQIYVDYKMDASEALPPILSIQYRVLIEAGETVEMWMLLGAGEDRNKTYHLLTKYSSEYLADRLFDAAINRALKDLVKLGATREDAEVFRRVSRSVLSTGKWPLGVDMSGPATPGPGHPTILLRINSGANVNVIEQLIRIQAYWRLNGLIIGLTIWNEDRSCYRHFLHRTIIELISNSVGAELLNRQMGGIWLRAFDNLSFDEFKLLHSAIYVINAEEWDPFESRLDERAYSQIGTLSA